MVDCALRALCTIMHTIDQATLHLKASNRSSKQSFYDHDADETTQVELLVGVLRDVSHAGIASLLAQLLMLGKPNKCI